MRMVAESFNRLPVRLVREDGQTIELMVQEYDITVERSHSAFAIPFTDALKFGIDVNQPNVSVSLHGVLVDDDDGLVEIVGQSAEGSINFAFSRTITRGGTSQTLKFVPSNFSSSHTNTSAIVYDEMQLDDARLVIPFTEWEGDTVYGVEVVFDGYRKGTKQEPFFYLNKQRTMTGITTNGAIVVSDGQQSLTVNVNGSHKEWMEDLFSTLGSSKAYRVSVGTSNISGIVNAFGANSFQMITDTNTGATTIPDGSTIDLLPNRNLPLHVDTTATPTLFPKVTIFCGDILNPDSTYLDGSAKSKRRSPDDELAYRLFKALTSSDSLGVKTTNPDGSTNIGKSSNKGSNLGALSVRRIVTQPAVKFSTPLGSYTIPSRSGKVRMEQRTKGNLSPGMILSKGWVEVPEISHFSGGVDATSIKSAGDKAQDLLGILSNSNNFNKTETQQYIEGFASLGIATLYNQLHNTNQKGDYIHGLQLPYDSMTTSGDPDTVSLELVAATVSGSETQIEVASAHDFAVGDSITISSFSGDRNSTMTVDLNGDHTVASVTNDLVFNISTASTGNSGIFTGTVSFDQTNENRGRKQRNFFVTRGNPGMEEKMSVSNTTPASTPFNASANSHRASGMKGLVEAFEVEYDAAQKVYVFDLLFRVARTVI